MSRRSKTYCFCFGCCFFFMLCFWYSIISPNKHTSMRMWSFWEEKWWWMLHITVKRGKNVKKNYSFPTGSKLITHRAILMCISRRLLFSFLKKYAAVPMCTTRPNETTWQNFPALRCIVWKIRNIDGHSNCFIISVKRTTFYEARFFIGMREKNTF